ncbi:hypothetical protein [Kordiimonas sp. SCSIO 12610]|uniref:hypothetical protein n=1 Tax=Kordiimonas sp. SCSIO 12610 TaxID=2829597 RepID=UPI00210ED0ED|nr:hypothetical protein [Kordiimonas sp. SCSIO 12610]UTW55924.1 hypothetical protein KFF44_03250 [Kordiimonas sp. SCSIO 12610]
MVLQGNKRTRFSLQTAYDVNTLPRILEILTIRDSAPEMISLRRSSDLQVIEMDIVDMDDHTVMVTANKMRQILTVQSVQYETLVSPQSATILPQAA